MVFKRTVRNKFLSRSLSSFSFQWKIAFVVSLLSVTVASLGFYYYYQASYQMTLDMLEKNLRDVGNVGAMLFDEECRNAIQRLKIRALEEAKFDKENINALPVGGTTKTISPEKVRELHASDDFKMILTRLQMISYASYNEPTSLTTQHEVPPTKFAEGMIATYLAIDLMNVLSEKFGMYLVSAAPEPIANIWPGNPIGNVFRSFESFSRLNQSTFTIDEIITDEFYQSLSATVPIFDKNNEAIAILGLDYSVGPALGNLNRLKQICLVLITVSLFLSLLVSFFISKSLSAPLYKLYNAAKRIHQNDYSESIIQIKTKDEFGLLGQVFNKMVAEIQYSLIERDRINKNLENLVKKRTQELEILSTTDVLTGLFNRRYMEEQIQLAMDRSRRYGNDISLVMIDIDYFKSINDTYGHDIGDKVLVSISRILLDNTREVDIVGRWGGEEFMLLIQDNVVGACTIAEKLRGKILTKDHGISRKITASFGCVKYIKNDTINSIVKRADQGLYKAKENGRNRIETITACV